MPNDNEISVISGYASAAEIAAMKDAAPAEQPATPDAGQQQQQPAQAETAKQPETPADKQQPAQQPATSQQPVQTADIWSQVTPEAFVERYKDKREEVLKALGVNDFMLEAIKYYDRTGNLSDYAEVKGVDYNKLSDDEILRRSLRQEFAHLELSPEDMETVYETRITNRFKTDAEQFSEKEVKIGKMEMKLEADRVRRQYIDNQKKFVAPELQKQDQPDPKVQMQELQQQILANPDVKQLFADKKLVLGSGDRSYNYEVPNPQELLDIMTNGETYMRHVVRKDDKGNPMFDSKGQPIVNNIKMMKAAAIIRDDAEYDRLLISHGISLGMKGVIDSVEHPETNKQGGTGEPQTLWGAFKNAKIS